MLLIYPFQKYTNITQLCLSYLLFIMPALLMLDFLAFNVFSFLHFLSVYKDGRHVALTARSAVKATWRGDGSTSRAGVSLLETMRGSSQATRPVSAATTTTTQAGLSPRRT